jgi:hypothetical protein
MNCPGCACLSSSSSSGPPGFTNCTCTEDDAGNPTLTCPRQ